MQDFVFLAMQAYLDSRQVDAYKFKRIGVLWAPDVCSEQFTMRRRGTLPPNDSVEFDSFVFDSLDAMKA